MHMALRQRIISEIYDEKNTNDNEIVEFANRPYESKETFYSRINNLFSNVKSKYADIIAEDESIEINADEDGLA